MKLTEITIFSLTADMAVSQAKRYSRLCYIVGYAI